MSKQEDALRKKIKQHFKDRVLWIEPTRGSTFGLPDCLLAYNGILVPVELKFETEFLRPAQKAFVRLAESHRIMTLIIRYFPRRKPKYSVTRIGKSNIVSEWYNTMDEVDTHISLLTER